MRRNLTELLRRLVLGEVDFVLVGGFAVVAHGCSLVTRDVDVAIALEEDNLVRLWRALEGLRPSFRGTMDPVRRFTEDDARLGGWNNMDLRTDLGPLDCLGEVKGIGDYEACLGRSIEQEFEDGTVRILERDSLIEAKLAVGRPQDLQAVKQLRILERQERREKDGEEDPATGLGD